MIELPKEMRKAAKLARKAGWTLEHRGSGHVMWLSPDKSVPPCDLSLLRRAGLPV